MRHKSTGGHKRDVSFQTSKKSERESTKTELMKAKRGVEEGGRKMMKTKRRRMIRQADERTDDADDDETKVAIVSSDQKEVYDGCSSSPRSKSCHWATSCFSTSPP